MKMSWLSAKAEMEKLNFDPRIVDIENEDEKYTDIKEEK